MQSLRCRASLQRTAEGDSVMNDAYDVVVAGSGGAGLLAALRATDLGLRAIVVEKSHRYGGTSAASGGGLWIPNHGLAGHIDDDAKALAYLGAVTQGADPRRLR